MSKLGGSTAAMGLRECLVDLRPSLGGFLFGDYTENRPGFPTLPDIRSFSSSTSWPPRRFDIIFCAGNCGGVCPDGRCGPNDFGPGRGIWGANAHPSVLTVGAVRTDTSWIGYSSEGPGPGRPPFNKLANQKPDLCAPSEFRRNEWGDSVGRGHLRFRGTRGGSGGVVPQQNRPESVVSRARPYRATRTRPAQGDRAGWAGPAGSAMEILNASAAAAVLPWYSGLQKGMDPLARLRGLGVFSIWRPLPINRLRKAVTGAEPRGSVAFFVCPGSDEYNSLMTCHRPPIRLVCHVPSWKLWWWNCWPRWRI